MDGLDLDAFYDAIKELKDHLLEEHRCDRLKPMHPSDLIHIHHQIHGEDVSPLLKDLLEFMRENT